MSIDKSKSKVFLQDTAFGDLTRGGQLVIHFFRMLGQVIRKFFWGVIVSSIAVTALMFFLITKPYDRYLGWQYVGAVIAVDYLGNGDKEATITGPDGDVIQTTHRAIRQSTAVHEAADSLVRHLIIGAVMSLVLALVAFFAFVAWIYNAGFKQRQDAILRGREVVSGEELKRILLKDKKASAISIGGVPLIKHSETKHIALMGSTGGGKSNALYDLLRQIRERGERCICYSPSGDFIQWFYREGQDHILNPFDARCPTWDLWSECTKDYHFDMVAAAVVPEPTKDPLWNLAARTVLASVAKKMGKQGEKSLRGLLQRILIMDMKELALYVRSTEAGPLLDEKAERTAASIRMNTAAFIKPFMYVPQDGELFNIRQWVESDKGGDWVFLNAKPDQIDAVRPVLSGWLELFTNALLSLPASSSRRVWLVIDELPSLNKIPSLDNFLSQARKYGGCGVLSFQQISQLISKYGPDGADTISGQCSTKVCMRQNDAKTAQFVSDLFGKSELLEARQGVSYGANDMRDGVTLDKDRREIQIVMPSEVMALPDLTVLLRLPDEVPVARFTMPFYPKKEVAESFIPRETEVDLFNEMESIMKSIDAATTTF